MRKKSIFLPRSIRLVIGGFSVALALGGCLAFYYAHEKILTFSNDQVSNANLVNRKGVFKNEADYFAVFGDKAHSEKRALAARAYQAALENNIDGRATLSEDQLSRFLIAVNSPEKKGSHADVTVSEFDRRAVAIRSFSKAIFQKCEELSYAVPTEIDLKKRIFAELARISDSLDADGTFIGDQSRIELSGELLSRLHYIQGLTTLSSDQKAEFIDACVPTLQRPHDLASMFRFEYMRIQRQIDYQHGTAKYVPGDRIFDKPRALSALARIQLALPRVESAWRSRLDLNFNRAIYGLVASEGRPKEQGVVVLARLAKGTNEDLPINGYSELSGIDWDLYVQVYSSYESYLFKVLHYPESSVHQ